MISAEMLGRLGNQMFVAAATHSLALDNKDEAVFPSSISGITPTDRETMLHTFSLKNTLSIIEMPLLNYSSR